MIEKDRLLERFMQKVVAKTKKVTLKVFDDGSIGVLHKDPGVAVHLVFESSRRWAGFYAEQEIFQKRPGRKRNKRIES